MKRSKISVNDIQANDVLIFDAGKGMRGGGTQLRLVRKVDGGKIFTSPYIGGCFNADSKAINVEKIIAVIPAVEVA